MKYSKQVLGFIYKQSKGETTKFKIEEVVDGILGDAYAYRHLFHGWRWGDTCSGVWEVCVFLQKEKLIKAISDDGTYMKDFQFKFLPKIDYTIYEKMYEKGKLANKIREHC